MRSLSVGCTDCDCLKAAENHFEYLLGEENGVEERWKSC